LAYIKITSDAGGLLPSGVAGVYGALRVKYGDGQPIEETGSMMRDIERRKRKRTPKVLSVEDPPSGPSERLAYFRVDAMEQRLLLPADALFDFDSTKVKREAEAHLQKAARMITEREISTVRIIGHADSVGKEGYNQTLSLKRAKAVKNWFVSKRAPGAGSFITEGKGDKEPVASNETPEGQAKNRRVEIRFR
jgi:OOP family OmpA-OmpF porin